MNRYSKRLSWHFSPNSQTKLIEAKRLAGTPLLDLKISNPTVAGLDYPHDRIAALFGAIPDFRYSPEASGMRQARESVCAHYSSRHGVSVDPGRVLLTASTSEAYSLLFKLLCDPGDEVLIPAPSYPLFDYLAALESVRTVAYPLRYDGSWYVDFARLEAAISERTRAVVVVSPNNPTGSFLKKAELGVLAELCTQHGIPVIADEVFSDYGLDKTADAVTTLAGESGWLSFSLNGLSKIAGMPQMKLGWIVVNGTAEEANLACLRLELILDTYLSVSSPVQRALAGLMEIGEGIRGQICARTRRNLEAAREILTGTAGHCLLTEAGWSAIVQLPGIRTEEEWTMTLLAKHDVIVQPGYFFDMSTGTHIVVSLLTEPAAFDEGLRRLRSLQKAFDA